MNSRPDHGNTWRTPGAALERFTGSPGLVAQQVRMQERVRYGYRIGTQYLLVPQGLASEVLPLGQLGLIPNSPPWLWGMANLRGSLVPVLDLHTALDPASTAPQRQAGRTLLVLGKGDEAVALLVDGYPQALPQLQSVNDTPAYPDALHAHVESAWSDGANMWLDFDHGAFLAILCRQIEQY